MNRDHLEVIEGDLFEVVGEFPESSFHAVVTDPPYGLAFMGKSWDQFEPREYQEWCQDWAEELFRVLKPGGHLLAFSGTRTYHRMVVGIEDAGFTIRDKVDWMYGGGFPKNHNVSEAIDRKLGVEDEREVVDIREETGGWKAQDRKNAEQGFRPDRYYDDEEPDVVEETAPASDVAKRFDDFGTALKPAHEPVVVARKPLEEDTIAEQMIATGTGALNIGDTRIQMQDGEEVSIGFDGVPDDMHEGWKREWMEDDEKWDEYKHEKVSKTNERGRHPPNVVIDEVVARELDGNPESLSAQSVIGDEEYDGSYSSDGPSRFFYTSKASQSERTMDGEIENPHPTVKPVDLMEWLVSLVTAEGQWVLDPFAGSGTTMIAADNVGRRCVGVEKSEEYVEVIRNRVEEHTPDAGSALDW